MNSRPTCGLTSTLPSRQVHAVPVVVRERDRVLVEHAHESGLAALVRALRPALGIRGREEEHVARLDERAVVVVDVSRDTLLEPVGEPRVSKRSCSSRYRSWYMPRSSRASWSK